MEAVIIVVAVMVAALGVGVGFYVRRRRYIAALEGLGWTFVDSPSLLATRGLNCSPFGVGTGRSVDDQIVGRTHTGLPFQAFEYSSSAYRAGGYAVAVRLPRSLPEFYHFPSNTNRPAVQGVVVSEQAGFTTVAKDPAFGEAALAVIGPTLNGYVTPPSLSIDHDQLVALAAPKKVDDLRVHLEALAVTAGAIAAAPSLERFRGEPPPAHLSVYGMPRWEYRARDSSLLQVVAHNTSGYGHTADDVLMSHHPVLPLIALTHHWKVDRTVTTTNSDGTTSTRQVTDHHSEKLLEFHPQFNFRPFKVNRGMVGDRIRFESAVFDQAFTVRCPSPRFASDIFHPRQMEYLLARRPYPFELNERGVVLMGAPVHDPAILANCEDFLLGFFGRVPRFTWNYLGYQHPPVPNLRGDV